uniref:Uncharacterized protein LOC108045863 n=1 Tax=Drosophila rhopaloa TaxID=1041015 RepID=A0A6P4F0C7_DRORH
MPSVTREKMGSRSTQGRGTKNAFINFMAFFKQVNGWIQGSQLEYLARLRWAELSKSQHRKFDFDKNKIDMPRKLEMVPFKQITEKPTNGKVQKDVLVLKSPTILRYSKSSILSDHCSVKTVDGEDINSDSNISSQGHVDFEKTKELPMVDFSSTDIIEISSTSITVEDKPFANFLLDFYVAHDTEENVHEVAVKWAQMSDKQREVYEAENYVLKLFSKRYNCDDIFDPVKTPMDVDTNINHKSSVDNEIKKTKPRANRQNKKENISTQKPRKPVKRLSAKVKPVKNSSKNGVFSSVSAEFRNRTTSSCSDCDSTHLADCYLIEPRNDPEESYEALLPKSRTKRVRKIEKKSTKIKRNIRPSVLVPVCKNSSLSAYKNFLRQFRRKNPGRLIVECDSIWRKMTPREKKLFR